jgi:polyphenol oxidase
LKMAAAHPDWLQPDWPAPTNVKSLCTTRMGGVSSPPWNSLNLGTHVGDVGESVQQNRRTLGEALAARPVFLEQVHGSEVVHLTGDTQNGARADGVFATQPGLACTIMVADCLPVLFCDVQGRQVAAAHAGWRGLAGTAGTGILEAVCKHFSPLAPVEYAQPAIEIITWLGPCIGPQAFEVGADVREAFVNQNSGDAVFFQDHGPGKWLADLSGLARRRLQSLGIRGVYGNDGTEAWCTVSNPLRFFSHRRDRVSGRFAACIWLD